MSELRAGASKVDITPPVGTTMDGYSDRPEPSTGIHDRLYCRALVLKTGQTKVALVSVDLCWLNRTVVLDVRKKATASGVDEVFLAATHTHSGPAVADFIVRPTTLGTDYILSLPGLIAGAIEAASHRDRPATIETSIGEANLSINRRLRSLPVDPTVTSLNFRDNQGKPVAGVLNYSCHPTVLGPSNRQVSADYPGKVAELVEAENGEGYVSLFLNGACGDVNPATCDGYRCDGSYDDVSRMAKRLMGAAKRAQGSKSPQGKGIFSGATRIGPLPPWGLSFELTAMDLDGVALLGVPGEVFASTGAYLRRALPSHLLVVSGFTNGYAGYFPTQDAFERKDYETRRICWVDASAEAEIRAGASSLLERVCKNGRP